MIIDEDLLLLFEDFLTSPFTTVLLRLSYNFVCCMLVRRGYCSISANPGVPLKR